jgi:cytochrome P450
MADILADVPYFNMLGPDFSLQSEEVRAARARSWYARTNYGLAVLRYEEAGELLRDRRLRQGSHAWPRLNGVTSGLFHDFWLNTLINKEGDDHARLRRLHNPAFSPRLIGGLAPRFQALASELIDEFHQDGRCEFVSQFAEPYAARVILILLGLPEEEWKIIADWSATIGLALTVQFRDELPRVEQTFVEMYRYADRVIAARRAAPGDDAISRLVAANSGAESRLSDAELRDALVNMVFAGMDTTRNQLGLAMATFLANPGQWELLAGNPELGKPAVEEVMRVAPTVTWVTREALADFTYKGVQIAAGTIVHLITESAGTDPAALGDASFDITAERPPHFGFGGGAHHCLGHFIARSDMSEALPLLARRLGDPRPDGPSAWLPDSGNTGPVRLPITFTAR